jgi:hypothetical protein
MRRFTLFQPWRAQAPPVLPAVIILVAVVMAAALSGIVHRNGAARAAQEAPVTTPRVVITGPSENDANVDSVVADLRQHGFRVIDATAAPSALKQSLPRSVVFTSNGFHASAPDLLRSLYDRNVVVAAINVSLPELSAVLEPGGPPRPPFPGFPPPPPASAWLPVSPQYTLFSAMTPGSETSDRLTSVNYLLGVLDRVERNSTPAAPRQGG